MKTKRTAQLIALFLFAASGLFAQAKKKNLQLDGKAYTIELYKEGKDKKYTDDEIKFSPGGKFKSAVFADWGFSGQSPYNCSTIDSTAEKKVYVMDCTTKPNDKKEIMVWNATVTGDDIEGTCEVQKNEKTIKSFTFTGTLKQKKTPGGGTSK